MTNGITIALLVFVSFLGALTPSRDDPPATASPVLQQPTEDGLIMSPGGVKIHYRLTGTGRDTVVVIADGPSGHMGAIAPDLTALTKQHRVLFYDQRGAGTSTAAGMSELKLADHVRDLEAIRMYVGMRRMRIVAHGFGAAIAAQYASEHAESVERIAMLAPMGVRKAWRDSAVAAISARMDEATRAAVTAARADTVGIEAACKTVFEAERNALFASAAAAAALKGTPCSAPPAALRFALHRAQPAAWQALGNYDLRTMLANVKVPTLVVHGEKDATPLGSAQEWATGLPDARLLVVANAGHFPYAESATTLLPALNTFFAGTWPEGAAAMTRVVTLR